MISFLNDGSTSSKPKIRIFNAEISKLEIFSTLSIYMYRPHFDHSILLPLPPPPFFQNGYASYLYFGYELISRQGGGRGLP